MPLPSPAALTTPAPDCAAARSTPADKYHVAGDAVALGHDEDARPVLSDACQRCDKGRALVDGGYGANALVNVPGDDANALASGPCFDGRTLGFRSKLLLVLGDADVGDRDER